MADMIFNLWAGIAGAAALLALFVFIPRYHIRTGGAWMRHPWGQHVMVLSICMAVILAMSVAFRALGEWPGRRWMVVGMFSLYAIELWHRVVLNETGGRPRRPAERKPLPVKGKGKSMDLNKYAKAIGAAVTSAYMGYEFATMAGSPAGAGITRDEWIRIVIAFVVVGVLTWAVPNAEVPGVFRRRTEVTTVTPSPVVPPNPTL